MVNDELAATIGRLLKEHDYTDILEAMEGHLMSMSMLTNEDRLLSLYNNLCLNLQGARYDIKADYEKAGVRHA